MSRHPGLVDLHPIRLARRRQPSWWSRRPDANPHECLPDSLLDVITGELKSKVDRIWDAFWSGGIANPLEIMEQITYPLFIRRLVELQTAKENRANRLGLAIDAPIFPEGTDEDGRPFEDMRWS